MTQAQNGSTVKVHYTGKLQDGTVFDSSKEREEPLEFTIGQGQLIPGFEQAVEGMEEGQSKTVEIPADQAYGQVRDDLVQDVPRQDFPENIELKEGQRLKIGGDGQQQMVVEVKNLSDDSVTLDANHPLAGKDLNFELELVEVK